nr:hypothetical protein BaRGS_004774 [Batillaria attramentaria]
MVASLKWAERGAVCAAADLRPEFVYYPNSRIRLNNLYEDSRPLDDCKLLCLGTYAGQCRTIDYRFSDGGCILAQVTALDLPSKWDVGVWDHDHYQITCA